MSFKEAINLPVPLPPNKKKKEDKSSSPLHTTSPLLPPVHTLSPQLSPVPTETHSREGSMQSYTGDWGDVNQYSLPPQDDLWETYDTDPHDNTDPDLYPSRPSLPDDTTTYHDLRGRAATYHKVPLHTQPLEGDFLFETLSSNQRRIYQR